MSSKSKFTGRETSPPKSVAVDENAINGRKPQAAELGTVSVLPEADEPLSANEALKLILDGTDLTERSSWAPQDMAEARRRRLSGDLLKPKFGPVGGNPERCIIYPGRTHTIFGASGSAKTMFGLLLVQMVLKDGYKVAVLDHEDNAVGIEERLTETMGIDPDVIDDPSRFLYIRPTEPVSRDRSGRIRPGETMLDALIAWKPDLVLIDGVTEAMVEEGLKPKEDYDVTAYFGLVPRRLTTEAGAAIISIDHTSKSNEGEATEYGSFMKRAGLSGASFRVELIKPFGRASGSEPVEGLSRIHVHKDREGFIEGWARDKVAGDFELTSWPDGRSDVGLVAAETSTATNELQIEIAKYLWQFPDESGSAISKMVTTSNNPDDTTCRKALAAMRTSGLIDYKKVGNAKRWKLKLAGKTKFADHLSGLKQG